MSNFDLHWKNKCLLCKEENNPIIGARLMHIIATAKTPRPKLMYISSNANIVIPTQPQA
jgi:hypothetical protein